MKTRFVIYKLQIILTPIARTENITKIEAAEVYLYPGWFPFIKWVLMPLPKSAIPPVSSVNGNARERNHCPPEIIYSKAQRKRAAAAVYTIIDGNLYLFPKYVGVVIMTNRKIMLIIGNQAQVTGGIKPSSSRRKITDTTVKLMSRFNRFPVLNRNGKTKDNQT